jgi:hypothetical protein
MVFQLLPGWRGGQSMADPVDNGTPVALMGLAACLIAPLAGLFLLRHAKNATPPAMRRWTYALYPAHFLLLLLVRTIAANPVGAGLLAIASTITRVPDGRAGSASKLAHK